MLVSELIIQVAKKYLDYDEDGSTDDEKYTRVKLQDWVDYYNSAQRKLVALRPDANYTVAAVLLAASATLQSLPAAAIALIDITRNMGTDGSTPGESIKKVNRKDLDDMHADWHTDTGTEEVDYYTYDSKKPKNFYVYPPTHATAAVYVEMAYSTLFDEIAVGAITITDVEADDVFIDPIIDWMMKCAYEKDSDSAVNWEASKRYEQSFYNGLGVQFKSSSNIAPKTKEK